MVGHVGPAARMPHQHRYTVLATALLVLSDGFGCSQGLSTAKETAAQRSSIGKVGGRAHTNPHRPYKWQKLVQIVFILRQSSSRIRFAEILLLFIHF